MQTRHIHSNAGEWKRREINWTELDKCIVFKIILPILWWDYLLLLPVSQNEFNISVFCVCEFKSRQQQRCSRNIYIFRSFRHFMLSLRFFLCFMVMRLSACFEFPIINAFVPISTHSPCSVYRFYKHFFLFLFGSSSIGSHCSVAHVTISKLRIILMCDFLQNAEHDCVFWHFLVYFTLFFSSLCFILRLCLLPNNWNAIQLHIFCVLFSLFWSVECLFNDSI